MSAVLMQRGFTLVEMMVVLSIISIISGVVISGQGQFNRSLIVTDTAYTVALSMRQAQTFGLSSRTYNGTSNAGYGLHFDAATPASYIMFADVSHAASIPSYCSVGTAGQPDAKSGNCLYDAQGNEVSQTYSFSRGFTASELCGHPYSGGALVCSSGGGGLTALDLVFMRPNTNSIITATISGVTTRLKDAQIQISAPNSDGTRYVCLTQSGQISVSQTICP